jgi:hypothetical protein
MTATARLPSVYGADGLAQQLQPTDVLFLGGFAVANLPTGSGIKAGSLAYATNGRALIGGALATLYFQAAGAGSGCLVTWSGSVWQVAGTATTCQQ